MNRVTKGKKNDREFAEEVGLDPSMLSKYKKNTHPIRAEIVIDICSRYSDYSLWNDFKTQLERNMTGMLLEKLIS